MLAADKNEISLDFKLIGVQQTLSLRRKLLWPELSEKELLLADDKSAIHFGAFHADSVQAVGVASFSPDCEYARLRKFAVDNAVVRNDRRM